MAATITLMRHGRPEMPSGAWRAPAQMRGWIAAYDAAGLAKQPVPALALRAAERAAVILTSPLRRAQETAAALNRPAITRDVPLLREAALDCGSMRWPKLPPQAWVATFRLAWML